MAIITISRGTFAGGEALADTVARRLGYECISREVMLDAAGEFGISLEKLTEAMEKPPTVWQQIAGVRTTYANYVRAALCQRARRGDLVYHGHAGHLLLAGVPHVIRIRVIADLEFRVRAAMERLRLGRKEAIACIEKNDKERAKWSRFLYGVDWNDPFLYDLVLNLEHLSVEGASEIVVGMTNLADFKPTPESVKTLDDLALGSRVRAALSYDRRTSAADVNVIANDGIVTITGTTLSREVLGAIPAVAAEVPGVKEVKCEVLMTWVHDSH